MSYQYAPVSGMQQQPGSMAMPAAPGIDMHAQGNTYYGADGLTVDTPYAPGMHRVDSGAAAGTAGNIQQTLSGSSLIVEVDIPSQLTSQFTHQEHDFKKLRYTACTTGPNRFVEKGYSLRQTGRTTDLLIVVTMYNEGPRLFIKTLQGIASNLKDMMKQDEKNWGPDGWRKVVISIISDGRSKINKDTLALIGLMGCYQEGLMRTRVGEREVQAHIFEATVETSFEGTPEDGTKLVTGKSSTKGVVPLQLLFILKEKNAKKINSHRWFFSAVAESLKPDVCLLLDVGTKPQPLSLYRLWRVFLNKQVGGACGEIAVEGNFWSLLNPIIAAQNFEYKMSNILDKPLESVAGFIGVLPGAFSAYRYEALRGEPLKKYFIGEKLHDSSDIFAGNMYLAEDRILCFEIAMADNKDWILRYEKNSLAITDAPDNFPEFISQRRRWLNGSTFASLYAIGNFKRVFSSGHSIFRKIGFLLELLYNFINFLFAFLALSSFYIAFHTLVSGFILLMENPNSVYLKSIPSRTNHPGTYTAVSSFLLILRPLYVLALCITFIASLGNRPQSARHVFHMVIVLFAIVAITMLAIIVLSTMAQFEIEKPELAQLRGLNSLNAFARLDENKVALTLFSLVATYGVYLVSSLLYLEWYHPIFNLIQYSLLTPTYVNVLQIYAFCNISDLSWGTKGASDAGHGAAGGGGGSGGVPTDELAAVPLRAANDFFSATEQRFNALVTEMRKPDEENEEEDNKEDNFKKFRTLWLMIWVGVNGLLAGAVLSPATFGITGATKFTQDYLFGLFIAVLIFSVIRFFFSCVYWLGHLVGFC
ncbi:hypothetical protein H9P43_009764 [Blastocladiella emersonii ATCC 22665]|nr:hypothetical protein H9P43_009764 [Blastocladiella emersonii ATCC 22665]